MTILNRIFFMSDVSYEIFTHIVNVCVNIFGVKNSFNIRKTYLENHLFISNCKTVKYVSYTRVIFSYLAPGVVVVVFFFFFPFFF